MSKVDFGRKFAAVGILLVWIVGSCTTKEVCVESTQARVNIGFYQMHNGKEGDTVLMDFSARGLLNSDSMLYDSANNVGKIALPLSQIADFSVFILTFSIPYTFNVPDSIPIIDRIGIAFEPDTIFELDTFRIIQQPVPDTHWVDSVFLVPQIAYYPLNDTIRFNYQKQLTLISEACGFTHLFTIEEVMHSQNVIDTVMVNDPEIILFDEENVKILF